MILHIHNLFASVSHTPSKIESSLGLSSQYLPQDMVEVNLIWSLVNETIFLSFDLSLYWRLLYSSANKNASTPDSMLQFLRQNYFLSSDFLSCCQWVQNTLCDDADSPCWWLTSPWRGAALCDKVTVSKRTLCSGLL